MIGEKPEGTPSLSDDQNEFDNISRQLWANQNGENKVGIGKVIAGQPLQEALKALDISPDFTYDKPEPDTRLLFVHRQVGNIEIYWVNNRNSRTEDLKATFRVAGKAAEIWHPETGKTEPASYTIKDSHTMVQLHLEPNDAQFVVFRHKTRERAKTIAEPKEQVLATIDGPWLVGFQENRGAPVHTTF